MLANFSLRRRSPPELGHTQRLEFFDRLKQNFDRRRGNSNMHVEQGGADRMDDMDYNARKKQNQDEIDAILDKIRKSGYDSLTKEEKQKLFEASRNS